MSSEMNRNDPKNLWQGQETEKMFIDVEEIRLRAVRLERRIYWRNVREYAGGGLVAAIVAVQVWHARGWDLAPPLLLLAGTIVVLFELHRRTAGGSYPMEAGLRTTLDSHLRELERQRDALRNVWKWYLAPFLPGFAATFAVSIASRGLSKPVVAFGALLVVLYAAVWKLNDSAANKLEKKIQELERMAGADE
jgi:hypothetical protein